MTSSPISPGLKIDQVLDRIRRDVTKSDDAMAIGRLIGQYRADLLSDRWTDLLLHVAQGLDLRVSRGEGTLDEAAEWAMPDMPVVLSAGEGDSRHFFIIHDHYGGRVLTTLGPDPFRDNWISRRELENRLNLSRDQRTVWMSFAAAKPGTEIEASDKKVGEIRGQRRTAVGGDHGHHGGHEDHGHARVSPLTRILQILRPEMKDIRVIGIYALATSVLGLASPLAVEALVATVGFKMLLQQVVVLSAVLFTFLALAATLFTIQKYVVEVIQRRIFVRIVADFAFRIPRVRVSAFDHHNGPELMNRFFDVMTIQKTLAGLLTDGIYLLITTVLGLSVMGFYHPYLLGFDIVLLTSIAGIILVLGRGGISTAVDESIAKYETAAWLEELARLPISMKHYHGRELALERADALARGYLDARRSHFRIVYRQVWFSAVLQVLASTALLGLGGWLVIEGQLTLGQLVASELIVAIVVGSFAKLGKYIEDFYDLAAAADKLGHIIDLPIEEEGVDLLPDTGKPATVVVSNATKTNSHGHLLVQPVTMRVDSGEKIALTGASGSGKSMLLSLIAGERRLSSGHVTIDNVDIRDVRMDSLRNQIAYVPEETPLQGSLIENVRMGRDSLSLREVRWALDVVGLENKMMDERQGLYTEIGSGGTGLSRGEANRLMIARAIVGQPRLLLIDGQLDSLDRESRDRILDVLLSDDASWTLIIGTQSSEIIQRMNRVITLESTHEMHALTHSH